MLALWVLWDTVVDANVRKNQHSIWDEPCYELYSGLGCCIALVWLWGANLYVRDSTHSHVIIWSYILCAVLHTPIWLWL